MKPLTQPESETAKPVTAHPIRALTVSISTVDRPAALAACLDALLAGEALPAEIVVVDQSTDARTQQVVAARQGGAVCIEYRRHAGRGLGAAQNLTFTLARHPIVAVTDDDCVPTPDWVARIAAALEPTTGLDAITGRILPLGPGLPGQYAVSSRVSRARVDFDRLALPWNIGSGNNFAVKREWLERIGGNEVRLGPGSPGLGGVDMDLFYRLLRAGARIRYEPDLLVYHARTSRAGRLARRFPYGYGMGACCMRWLRQRDPRAGKILVAWLLMRARRLVGGLWRREWQLAYEEILVLTGTLRGLPYGWHIASGENEP